MEIRQLRHLVALAEVGNFQRAADAVGLSQSALSRSIQALERDLDCVLIERSSRDFRLTGQGELVLQHARQLIASTQVLRNELEHYNGLKNGEVRFASGTYAAQLLAPRALAEFIQAHARVQVVYLIGTAEQMKQALKDKQIEFFIGDARYFYDDPLYRVERLGVRPGHFFCRAGHPLLNTKPLYLEDLIRYPLVGARIPEPVRQVLAEVVGERDFQVNIECGHFDAILHMVLCSDAVGLASVDALYSPLHRDEIVLLELAEVPYDHIQLQVHYGVVTRTDHVLSPAAQALIQILRETDQKRLLTLDSK